MIKTMKANVCLHVRGLRSRLTHHCGRKIEGRTDSNKISARPFLSLVARKQAYDVRASPLCLRSRQKLNTLFSLLSTCCSTSSSSTSMQCEVPTGSQRTKRLFSAQFSIKPRPRRTFRSFEKKSSTPNLRRLRNRHRRRNPRYLLWRLKELWTFLLSKRILLKILHDRSEPDRTNAFEVKMWQSYFEVIQIIHLVVFWGQLKTLVTYLMSLTSFRFQIKLVFPNSCFFRWRRNFVPLCTYTSVRECSFLSSRTGFLSAPIFVRWFHS